MNFFRILLPLCCLLALQGCFESPNDNDQDKDTTKSSVQVHQSGGEDK